MGRKGTRVPGKRYVRRVLGKKPHAHEKNGDNKERLEIRLTVRGMTQGTVRLEAEDGSVYTCSRREAQGLLWGDAVAAQVIGRERVRIVRVAERAHAQIMGVLHEKHGQRFLVPLERRLPPDIAVRPGGAEAGDGDIVLAKVIRWGDEGGLLVRVDARVGSFTQSSCALDALVAISRLRTDFPPEALQEAEACREACMAESPDRQDLRSLLTFTIDGRDARDFDDAVSLEHLAGACVRLYVHIADVGHYVPEGSALDREAFLRGTSVYFPGRVLPMLPKRLSDGVCSLRPGEEKYALSAIMDFDGDGQVTALRVERTLIRSDARLVYDDVNALFAGSEAVRAQLLPLEETLLAMRALSARLRADRERQGAIDFDTLEPMFVLDEAGEPTQILRRERGEAECMIEDFMLCANACIARYAQRRGLPILYRVHEKPDPEKLDALKDFLDGLGVDTRGIRHEARPGDIRAVLERMRQEPEFAVVSMLALRSMKKACYDAEPLGHYGLAMEDYCHFTSPIRRYPDLVVSRALTAALTGARVRLRGDALAEAARQSSVCERAAADAERAADKLMMARYMAGHVGEAFRGVVSGVSEWGVHVLMDNGAEGFMHVRTLEDWFAYDERRMTLRGERTGVLLSPGLPLCVRVQSVSLEQSLIDLMPAEPLHAGARVHSAKKAERARMRGYYA